MTATVVLGVACAGSAAPSAEDGTIFRPYPGGRRLCSQHASGNTMHINRVPHAAEDAPESVRAFYEKNTSGAAVERGDGELVNLRGPNRELLSIHDVEERYPSCGVAPSGRDRTVVVVSAGNPSTGR